MKLPLPPPAEGDKTPPLRVVMVAACPFPANHGTPGAIRELCEALVRLGHETHVVTYPLGDDVEIPGVTVHRVSAPWMKRGEIKIGPSKDRLVYDALLVPKLCSVIRRHKIDVIHSHNYEATIAGIAAKWLTGRPLVYNGINSMADELPSYAFFKNKRFALRLGEVLDKTVPRGADAIIALSDELKDYLATLGISRDKTVVMPLGVDVPLLTGGDAVRVRARHGLAADTPIVMYTGSIEYFQRVDYLVEAFGRVAAQHPRAVLMIANNISNAEARAGLEKQAEQMGIAGRLLFAESVALADLRDYLAAADVAVVPRPTCPGFPVKLLNYMAAGRAIASFAGSAKSVCHGYNAYVSPNHDVGDLATGISLLLSDAALRSTLGRRAFDSLSGVYDWITIARATAMVYHQVCQPGRKLDKQALGLYLKAEYTPRLSPQGRDNPAGFLQSGPIEYPAFEAA
jgi:1,2-diacylglycerol 3-alpha-glucosyltransferase